MKRYGPKVWALILVVVALWAVSPLTAAAQDTQCPSVSTYLGFTLHFEGVDVDNDAGTSTWNYCLEWNGVPPSLSHLTIGVCGELTDESLIDVSPMGAVAIGKDGSTGLYGIKWDFDPGLVRGQCYPFTFTLNEIVDVGPVPWIAKAGPGRSIDQYICGPSLECTSNPCIDEEATLKLDSYETVAWDENTLLWTVRMSVKNFGPGAATNVAASIIEEIPWVEPIQGVVSFPDIPAGESMWSENNFVLDLSGRPGPGGFNVFFDVTYQTNCGNGRHILLDPEAIVPGEKSTSSRSFVLSQNSPNPFNPQTTISFTLAKQGHVSLNVYDRAGRLVKKLVNDNLAATQHSVIWNGRDDFGRPVSSGVYYYRLATEEGLQTKSMILVK